MAVMLQLEAAGLPLLWQDKKVTAPKKRAGMIVLFMVNVWTAKLYRSGTPHNRCCAGGLQYLVTGDREEYEAYKWNWTADHRRLRRSRQLSAQDRSLLNNRPLPLTGKPFLIAFYYFSARLHSTAAHGKMLRLYIIGSPAHMRRRRGSALPGPAVQPYHYFEWPKQQ